MKRTDHGKIEYPDGMSAGKRRHCRKMIATVAMRLYKNSYLGDTHDTVVIACSGGMDSTVLAHATAQALKIFPKRMNVSLVYVNHNIRSAIETKKEGEHVKTISLQWFNVDGIVTSISLEPGENMQASAHNKRYAALSEVCHGWSDTSVVLFTAHHMNDVAETKLFRFLTGREEYVEPILARMQEPYATIKRPFLQFTKEDIALYAESFGLSWCEDSSNAELKYTRNKIRQELIPWIEENINPGFVRSMNKEIE